MKAFVVWLVAVVAAFSLAAGGYHLLRSRDPARVYVVVDSSFSMEADWDEVVAALDDLDDRRYAEFALSTEKNAVHSWSDRLDIAGVSPYAPRDLSRLLDPAADPELAEATEQVLVTNAPPADLEQLDGWTIVRVGG